MRTAKQHFAITRCLSILFYLISCFIVLSLSGCAHTAEPVSQIGFYLDTVIQITLYDTDGKETCSRHIQECFTKIDEYEHLFSATIEGSDVWNINHSGGKPVTVSDDTASLLKTALYYSELSGGRVDATVLPLSCLWDFGSGKDEKIPGQEEIEDALSHVDYRTVHIDGNTVTLSDPHAAIDLGFIAKGYIGDRLKEYLLSQKVQNACINLGGNLVTINGKPDGQPYRVGIQEPFGREGEAIAVISVKDASVVSSGIYERYFNENGTLYHHLLDTKTGYPADNDIAGVTILSSSSLEADALSTACYFLGTVDGMELIESLDGVEVLFIMKDGTIYRSDGFPELS